MYADGSTTYVEINTKIPLTFRLPAEALGLDDWSLSMLNKDNGQVIAIADFIIGEIGEFTPRTQLNGSHDAGSQTIVVEDSTTLAVGKTIRIENSTFRILAINQATHLITLDSVLPVEYAQGTQVKEVLHPQFLGKYKCEFSPTLLGNFEVCLVDNTGMVTPIEDLITVVASLRAGTGSGKISPIGRVEM